MEFRNAYSPRNPVVRNFAEVGRTKQEFKETVDINNILRKYIKTGNLEHMNQHEARYSFCTGDDFQSAMEKVVEAQDMFMDLPAETRNRFANDPAQFLDFVQDPKNLDEMRELGLAVAVPPPQGTEDNPKPAVPEPTPANTETE